MSWMDLAVQMSPQLVAWRRHLHQYPELSFQEYRTQEYVMDALSSLGIKPQPLGQTGVVADIGEGPRGVAVRADIDALPLQEESSHEFRSQNAGVMHACGHDGHTAMLLGVAALLSNQGPHLPGRVRVMFQPAEEKIPGGARMLIEEGVLDNIDRVLGLHLSSDLPTGQVGTRVGTATANADQFTITIEGKGGHGAKPEQAVDPVVVAAELVLGLQSIVSRNITSRHAAVLTIGTLHSGSNFNIIASRATLTGTVRTFWMEDRQLIKSRMQTVVEHVCSAHGAVGTLNYLEGYPSVVNSPQETEMAGNVISRMLGQGALVHPEALMAGEDFAYYLQECPGTFLSLGCRNPGVGAQYPHHHPQFTLDEAALPTGTAILSAVALEFLTMTSPTP